MTNLYKINSYYEGLVQNFYAGAKGCFAVFMHFFYQFNQSVIFKPQLSVCFKELYKAELQNCQILSQILIKIGGDNKYFSSSRKFISGYNVDYVKNFNKIFLLDIELLEINILELKGMIDKIESEPIKKDLKIILENKKNSLKKIKENYFKNNLIG